MKKRRRPTKSVSLRLPWGGNYTPKNGEERKLIAKYKRGLYTEEEIMRKLGLGTHLFKHRTHGLPMAVIRLVLKLRNATRRRPYIPKGPERAGFKRLEKAMLVGSRVLLRGPLAVEKPGAFDRRGRQEYDRSKPKEVTAYYPRASTEAVLEVM